jgi:hypothetical protein
METTLSIGLAIGIVMSAHGTDVSDVQSEARKTEWRMGRRFR